MANPYMVNTPQPQFLDFANSLIHMKLAREDQALRQRQLDETSRVHGLEYGTGTPGQPGYQPGLKQQGIEAQNREVAAKEQQNLVDRAKLGVLGQQFTPRNAAAIQGRAKAVGLDKALQPELEAIRTYGMDPQYTMEAAHNDFTANWGQRRADILNRLQDEYAGKVAKDPNFENTKEGKEFSNFMDRIYADNDGSYVSGLLFPGVAEAKGMIRSKAQAENVSKLYDIKTIYGPNGEVDYAPVMKGGRYQLPQGWTDKDPVTESIREYNLAVKQGYKGTYTQWDKDRRRSGATSIGLNIGPKSMQKLGETMSEELVKERKDVGGAVAALENTKEAEKLLNSGMITGTGAEYLVNLGNLLSSRLGITYAEEGVANTQAFAATMGNQVGQIIKQFGSGTGLSDADREYAEKIVGGKITMNEQAIRKLLAINKKAYTNVIKNFNKRAEQVMNRPESKQLPYDLRVDYKFDETGNDTRPPLSSFQR